MPKFTPVDYDPFSAGSAPLPPPPPPFRPGVPVPPPPTEPTVEEIAAMFDENDPNPAPGELPVQPIAPPKFIPVDYDPFKEESSALAENVVRPLARTAKNAAVGALSIPELFSRPLGELMDVAARGLGFEGGFSSSPSQFIGESIDKATDGLTIPRNSLERVVDTASQAIASAGPLAAVTRGTAAANLAPRTATELSSFGTAGGGAQVAREVAPDSPAAELAGAVTGALVPGTAVATVKAAAKAPRATINALTKINPKAAQDFADEGISTSLAAVSDSPAIKLFDRALSKFPGGAGVIEKNSAQVLDDIQKNLASKGAVKGGSAQEAGEVIQRGVSNYVKRFQDVSGQLYSKLDDAIPGAERFPVNNVINAFDDISTRSSAPRLQARLRGSEGFKILKDITDDAAPKNGQAGLLEYKDIKRYRTLIGQKLSKPHLLPGEDEAVLRQAYEALSLDMGEAAASKGPAALKAFERANSFYRQGAQQIEKQLQSVVNKRVPEKVYQALLEGSRIGGTRVNSIMKALSPEEQEFVRGTVLKKLGEAAPGAQSAAGEQFSVRTYLTNWNRLSPEAKTSLFGKDGTQARDSLNRIAGIAERLKDIERFSNPSGTASQLTTAGLLGGAFYKPLEVATAVIGANGSARLLTNRDFVNWLARLSATKQVTPQTVGSALKQLSTIAERNPEITDDIARYTALLGSISSTRPQPSAN